MTDNSLLQFKEVPEPSSVVATAAKVQFGKTIPAQQQLLLYCADEWERFIEEWVHSQNENYSLVRRYAGTGDMGIDIAGCVDTADLKGVWDNFQCKHYGNALPPSTAAAEIAKVLWYSFQGEYVSPRAYYFIAPRGCGTALTRLLDNPASLKKHIFDNWDKQCAKKVTDRTTILLENDFFAYVNQFNFSIFRARTLLEIVDEHRRTPYYANRFGGGLPERPIVEKPPKKPVDGESRYIAQLFEAYADHTAIDIFGLNDMAHRQDLVDHYHRQRETFYHAEALRNFSRDTVPPGTFEELQEEVYSGIIDIEGAPHNDAYTRLNSVTQTATQLQITSNALISVVKIHDRKGICHQLANEDRLRWRKAR
jgi:hypothetical protein